MNAPVPFTKGCYVGSKVLESAFRGIITSETVFPAGSSSDWHYHENPHFSHILSGGSTEVRSAKNYFQAQGEGLYYYPGVAHQNVGYRPGTRIFNVELEASFFKTHGVKMPNESLMYEPSIPLNTGGLVRILKEHRWNDQASSIAMEQLCINLLHSVPKLEDHHPRVE